jgi:uncharacterized protein YgbK (DUF1537 family)
VSAVPTVRKVSAEDVQHALADSCVVILDDDPTGTQTVRDLPVLTSWTVADIRWALDQATAGFFVLTNTRSLPPDQAAQRNREVVRACRAAAEGGGVRLVFASRSDSTLRGHFPLETDVISEMAPADAVLLAPAYVDAGRVTIDGTHWLRTPDGLVQVGDSEFARDPTFGYRSSVLAEWVEEKSRGRIRRESVAQLTLEDIRCGTTETLAAMLSAARDGQVIAVDADSDDDLRAVVLAVLAAEAAGSRFIYRVGPSFIRARVGQACAPPIDYAQIASVVNSCSHGLVVVGSHVALSSRQLARLAKRRQFLSVELDVPTLMNEARADQHVRDAADRAIAGLGNSLVVLSTSRLLVTAADESASLEIARRVSAAFSRTVRQIVAAQLPAFVVAKGGITSSVIASDALGIGRAWARGSLLPGIVSLWEPVSGPAAGLPYVVFAGNVGDEDSLADVVDRLEPA